MLAACQVVLITAGRGRFESRATGLQPVEAGTAMVVLPGVWHRYAPDAATGWEEQWIELRGAVVENLQRRGILSAKNSLIAVERRLELAGLFEAILSRFGSDTAVACDPERAALGLQVLALISGAGGQGEASHSITALIGRAERLLADRVESAPVMPVLARELGVAYSHFRREFKRHTGLSPQRYLGQLRLEKACRILGTTAEPVKAIADRLGFCSQYHFSAAFKRHFGVAPDHWRRRHVGETIA